MLRLDLRQNPFQVRTPEDMHPEDVVTLFVEKDFAPYYKLQQYGHAMLVGPRGCGKSMAFRFMLPDCQRLHRGASLRDLPYFASLVRFKNVAPNVTDLRRLDRHADKALNEHLLTTFVGAALFSSLALATADAALDSTELETLYEAEFLRRLLASGWTEADASRYSHQPPLRRMASVCDGMYEEAGHYINRLGIASSSPVVYAGPLCGYLDFLLPIVRAIRRLSFLPDAPIYLLLDDADYLNETQTRVLNSRLSTRTHSDISLKVSTQLQYKTYRTLDSLPIQSPHDFQEINAADLYTSRGAYHRRVRAIVEKRFRVAGMDVSPEEFFPEDVEQNRRIDAVKEEIRAQWGVEGRGYRVEDDVTRYAVPEYLRRLAGSSKSTPSYYYAGFDQLVHISSGIIRAFLDAADRMHDEERSVCAGDGPRFIPPHRQNDVLRQEADRLMFDEIDKLMKGDLVEDDGGSDRAETLEEYLGPAQQLHNLLRALGGTFRAKLVSRDSERRVFSVAMSGKVIPEVQQVLELGVQHGYFHKSTIGNKDGTGRQRLYVMTRRLAPHFNLDPSSFAGYLWVSWERLWTGIQDPDRLLRRVKDRGVEHVFEEGQLHLFA